MYFNVELLCIHVQLLILPALVTGAFAVQPQLADIIQHARRQIFGFAPDPNVKFERFSAPVKQIKLSCGPSENDRIQNNPISWFRDGIKISDYKNLRKKGIVLVLQDLRLATDEAVVSCRTTDLKHGSIVWKNLTLKSLSVEEIVPAWYCSGSSLAAMECCNQSCGPSKVPVAVTATALADRRYPLFSGINVTIIKNDIVRPAGFSGVLRCKISFSLLQMEWKLNGSTLKPSERVVLAPDFSLRFANAQTEDSGEYECIIRNYMRGVPTFRVLHSVTFYNVVNDSVRDYLDLNSATESEPPVLQPPEDDADYLDPNYSTTESEPPVLQPPGDDADYLDPSYSTTESEPPVLQPPGDDADYLDPSYSTTESEPPVLQPPGHHADYLDSNSKIESDSLGLHPPGYGWIILGVVSGGSALFCVHVVIIVAISKKGRRQPVPAQSNRNAIVETSFEGECRVDSEQVVADEGAALNYASIKFRKSAIIDTESQSLLQDDQYHADSVQSVADKCSALNYASIKFRKAAIIDTESQSLLQDDQCHVDSEQSPVADQCFAFNYASIKFRKSAVIDTESQSLLQDDQCHVDREQAVGDHCTASLDHPLLKFNSLPDDWDSSWEYPRKQLVNFEPNNPIGEGQFGRIFQVGIIKHREVREEMMLAALKVSKVNTDEAFRNLVQEFLIMKTVGPHENIIKLLGCCTQGGPFMVLTELARYGNLRNYLRKCHSVGSVSGAPQVSLQTLERFATEIAEGMAFLVSKQVIHCDLAARNILVCDNYTAKIADFGLAKTLADSENYRATMGSFPYKWMALETLLDGCFTCGNDVWSFGILLWEIMSYGRNPYSEIHETAHLVAFLQSGQRMMSPPKTPVKYSSIMQSCWHSDPHDRPTFPELKMLLQKREFCNPEYMTRD